MTQTRKRLKIFLISVCSLFALGYIWITKASLPTIAATTGNLAIDTQATTSNLSWPQNSEAAVGVVGGAIATNSISNPFPTASTAKMVAALTILQKYPLKPGQQGPSITLTQADVNIYNAYVAKDGSVAKVVVGERISEYQALQAMLIASANNLADTLAIWAFGSMNAYSMYANNFVQNLGLTQTTIGSVDASGFDSSTISTAHDLVIIGEAALNQPVIAQIVGQSTAVIPVAGQIKNVNWLLGSHGINGIKTGNSDQAGGVYLFSARKDFSDGETKTIVGAIVHAPSLQQAMDKSVPLLISAENHLSLITLIHSGQVVGHYHVPWLGNINAIASRDVMAVAWLDMKSPLVNIHLDTLHAPTTAQGTVGYIDFPTLHKTDPIILSTQLMEPSLSWRITHP